MPPIKFLNRKAGNSFVEHAIFLALIGGAMYVAYGFVGIASGDSFGQVAQQLHSPGDTELEFPSNTGRETQVRQLATALGVMAFGVLAWFFLYVLRRKGTSADGDSFMGPTEIQRDAIFKKRQQIFKTLSEHVPAIFGGDIQVSHLMSKRLTTVLPSTTAKAVQLTMKSNRLRHLLVCTEDRKLVGIISIRDIHKGKDAMAMMTPNPHTVEPTSLLGPTITLLIHNRISCLPVIKNGVLVGIITTTDILMGMQGIAQIFRKLAAEGQLVVPSHQEWSGSKITQVAAECEVST